MSLLAQMGMDFASAVEQFVTSMPDNNRTEKTEKDIMAKNDFSYPYSLLKTQCKTVLGVRQGVTSLAAVCFTLDLH